MSECIEEQKVFYGSVESILQEYIPHQLLQEVKEKRKNVQVDGKDMIQFYLDNSNNKLRAYGTAKELEASLKVFWSFPMRRKMFPTCADIIARDQIFKYQNLKGEILLSKLDMMAKNQESYRLLCKQHNMNLPSRLAQIMKRHEEQLSKCFEFVKYDKDKFSKVLNSIDPRNVMKSYELAISNFPSLFLPNSEIKDTSATVVVRIFEEGDRKFVMESELFNAINFKNSKCSVLVCKDSGEFLRTIDMREVYTVYRNRITDIDFIRTPITCTKYSAVPIPTPDGEFCVPAWSGLLMIYNRLWNVLNVYQIMRKIKWHIFQDYISYLESQFPSNIDCPLFIKYDYLKKITGETDNYWEKYRNIPIKLVRDVGPNGFTVDDLKSELEHLGWDSLFLDFKSSDSILTVFYNSVSPEKDRTTLTTFDMIDVLAAIQTSYTFQHFPQQNILITSLKTGIPYFTPEDAIPEEKNTKGEDVSDKDEQKIAKALETKLKKENEKEVTESKILENHSESTSSNMFESECDKFQVPIEKVRNAQKCLLDILQEKANRTDELEMKLKNKEAEFEKMKKFNENMIIENLGSKLNFISEHVIDKESQIMSILRKEVLKVSAEHDEKRIAIEIEGNILAKKLNAEIDNLKSQLNVCRNEKETFRMKYEKSVETKKAEKKKKSAESERKLKETQEELVKIKKRISEDVKKKNEEVEKFKKMQKEVDQLKQNAEKLEAENEVLTARIDEKEAVEARMKQKSKELIAKIQSLEESAEKNQMKTAMKQKQLEAEISANDRVIRELQDSNKYQQKEHERDKEELQNKVSRVAQQFKQQQAAAIDKLLKELVGSSESPMLFESLTSSPKASRIIEDEPRRPSPLRCQLLGLQKIKDALYLNSPLKLALEMKEKLISLSTQPEIHQMAIYEYQQYEGKLRNYQQEVEKKIQLLKKSDDVTALPSLPDFPSFSDRFIQEYWLEVDKQKTSGELQDSECLFCFIEMKSEEKTLKCEHCRKVTHLECASKWLKIHRSCPHCRREQLDPNEFPNLQ